MKMVKAVSVPVMVKKEATSYYPSVTYSVSKSFQSETTEQLRIKPSLFSTYLFDRKFNMAEM